VAKPEHITIKGNRYGTELEEQHVYGRPEPAQEYEEGTL
jgi:hypothetical protein